MRKMNQPPMMGVPLPIQSIFNQIFQASLEADVVDIAAPYTFTGTPTETRNLNVSAPTTANIAAVLATLILDLQRGGATKTT